MDILGGHPEGTGLEVKGNNLSSDRTDKFSYSGDCAENVYFLKKNGA